MDLLRRFNASVASITEVPQPIEIGGCMPPAKLRSGVCIILGTHPCYLEDVQEVLRHYPKADICGVNEAARLVKCDHMATCHGGRMGEFVALHKQHHPRKKLPVLHVRDNESAPDGLNVHTWSIRTMSGSAPFAAVAMLQLGYELVIMCGCPMDGGGGYAFDDTHKGDNSDPRIGFMKGNHSMLRSWHHAMRKFKEEYPDMAAKIRSMSGKSKEIFGGLDGIE